MGQCTLGWVGRVALGCALAGLAQADSDRMARPLVLGLNGSGVMGTFKADGPIDRRNEFFKSLGSNGRSCATCHLLEQAASFTPSHARQLYRQTHGADPLFAPVDGANCDQVARTDRAGHSLILQHGLIRVANAVPANAEFAISVVRDPYGCALRVDPKSHVLTASVYRRPLPSTNLGFLSAVMFDGRETLVPLTSADTLDANLRTNLRHQAIDAVLGHAEGATGGPIELSGQLYYPGINDSLGAEPNGIPFTPASMTLYSTWEQRSARRQDGRVGAARADIAAGENLFNTLPMAISNVRGLNDSAALGKPTTFVGNCASCHDTPNVGHHSLPLPLDIGTGHSPDANQESDVVIADALAQLSLPDLPVFLVSGCPNPFNAGQAESFYTTDPGRALISGKCADFNRIKGPILRGLAGRAPYFHNGAAASLLELVNFYDRRFKMGMTREQKHQLVAFLNTL
ncbi:MAG: hypothetical protein JSS24_03555 [Proteobacteria bacterium]|nr:hypothetical protein [Pseudomonadota bacterium]